MTTERDDEVLAVARRLRVFVKHDGLCGIVGGYNRCTCGLDDALALYDAIQTPSPTAARVDEQRQQVKDAYLAGFAAARRGNAEAAWEESRTRLEIDYPAIYPRALTPKETPR